MVLPIVTFPSPILRKPAEPVSFPLSKDIKKLTRDMFDTLKKAGGVGLAAPQVNRSVRLVVIDLQHLGIPPFVLYNPKVVKVFSEKVTIQEGCLSVPGVFAQVARAKKILLEAQNAKGEIVRLEDDGWIARVVQHEIDHINGVLILDKAKQYDEGLDLVKEWEKQKLI